MTTPASPSYAGHRFPAEIISHAVWLYFRFPLSLRHDASDKQRHSAPTVESEG
jgi:transposase-like protein